MAEAGKDKASTLTKKVGKRNSTFSFFTSSFSSCLPKKVDETLHYINFHVFPSGGQFFSSRISFFTSYYNFEVNRHEKVGQKRETANFEDIRLRGGQYNILGLRGVSQKVMRVKGGVISKANKRIILQ